MSAKKWTALRIAIYLVTGAISAVVLFVVVSNFVYSPASAPRMSFVTQMKAAWLEWFPQYGETGEYIQNWVWYQCSKPVKARQHIIISQMGWVEDLVPIDPAETKLFCHPA